MTVYMWISLVGVALAAIVAFFGNEDKLKERVITSAGFIAAGLFLYGLVTSVADIVS